MEVVEWRVSWEDVFVVDDGMWIFGWRETVGLYSLSWLDTMSLVKQLLEVHRDFSKVYCTDSDLPWQWRPRSQRGIKALSVNEWENVTISYFKDIRTKVPTTPHILAPVQMQYNFMVSESTPSLPLIPHP
jgi:hypothetical protein